MTTVHYKNHGGRRKRYVGSRGEVIEVFDPWESRSLQFRSRPAHDLWLLRRSSPGVKGIVVYPPSLLVEDSESSWLVCPDLAVIRGDGYLLYEVLTRDGDSSSANRLASMKWLEQRQGVRWRHTRASELLPHLTQIENMAFARQSLTLHHDHALGPLSCWVTQTVGRLHHGLPGIELGALRAELTMDSGLDALVPLNAVLFRLRDAECIAFDISKRITNETFIRPL